MTGRDIVDDIDALIDEQLAAGESGQARRAANADRRCGHCGRAWHGLAITTRMEEMRREYLTNVVLARMRGEEYEYWWFDARGLWFLAPREMRAVGRRLMGFAFDGSQIYTGVVTDIDGDGLEFNRPTLTLSQRLDQLGYSALGSIRSGADFFIPRDV
ncbi:DNA binding protein [Gordonia phage UmaThurman]|uniref:DNA binding protein n=1 Tax=Gordonia phage UmaThurman TaxID=1821563 RepID=UPI00078E966F|nr:DNA binding protein [Gordonia phage UmaThurman]AMS03975.1 hypothetical protein SEA_UMATHURMAN_75 [Gordonia phage UmaThurman]